MSVIDDLGTAVADYATNDCNTIITGYSVTTGPSTGSTATLNSGDEFQFEVFNNGLFDMKNVKIKVNGTKWADVALSGSTGVFGSTALLDPTPPINIDAGKSFTTGFFRGKGNTSTPSSNPQGVFIVTAQIDGWDGALDAILNGSSGSGDAEGTLKQVISPA